MTIKTITEENLDAFVTENELAILDFSADWCSPCKSFAKVCETAAKEFPQAVFGNIDIEAQPKLASEFNVQSIPFVVILRYGMAVFAQAGEMSFTTLADLIKKAEFLNKAAIEKQIQQQQSEK